MTKIVYDKAEYTVTIVGHAGAGVPGEDVVCAGISALTEAMLQRVRGRRKWQPAYGINREKAIVRVHLTPRSSYAAETAREMLETVCAGYRAIAGAHPEHVVFEER